jgi:hypothetical protein
MGSVRCLILTLFGLSLLVSAHAQKLFLNLDGGFANYDGELQSKKYTFQQSHPGAGIGLGYEFNPHFNLSTEILYTRISANDKYDDNLGDRERNLNFTSNILEWNVRAEYVLFDLTDRFISPYVFGGLAIFHFNPYTFDSTGRKVFLQKVGTEGEGLPGYAPSYKLTQLAIPLGLGLRMALSENIRVGLEVGLRKTFTGYLDDVHSNYVAYNTLVADKGQEAAALAFRADELPGHTASATYPPGGSKRGDGETDWYYFTAVRLSIRLNGRKYTSGKILRCPRVPL